jgi:hypothetical protein
MKPLKTRKMKASELGIGNLLQPKKEYHNQFHGAGNVTSIEESKFVILDHYPGKWFEPIPLTEEWLLKFGFEHEDDYLELQINEHLSIIYVGYLALMIDGVIIQVNNTNSDKVHQLQNLYFALTGEELTLKSE